ncbi:MFS transporter [Spongiactinospora gelatinilytica]|uniref:MFS transporter n=1 Tax=Spongiactinospora gelatinilytica TaxID=2666298 RepID=UPI001F215458|nr:MFS transporter [Spongiactinospora gelatinilytica]
MPDDPVRVHGLFRREAGLDGRVDDLLRVPLAIGIARQQVPRERLPTAIGVLSAMMGVGSGGGMILAGLVCLLLAVSKAPAWGWTSAATLGLLAASAALFAAWVLSARRTTSPLIEIPMLLHRGTVGATVASLLLGFALFGVITTLSAVAQQKLGASVLQVGLYLLPTALLMLVVSLLAGRLMRRFTASSLVGAGSAVVTCAAIWLSVAHGSPADLYGAASVLGLGIGLGYAALGTMAVEHVEPAKTAAAGGVNALVRIVGSSVAGAVTGAVLPSAGAGWSFAAAAVAALLSAAFAFAHGTLGRTPTAVAGEAA